MSMELGRERIIHRSRDEFGELTITDGDFFRTLYFGNRDKQSCMLLGQPHILTLKYTQVMASALMFKRHPERVLVLGLGGGSLPKFFLHACPQARVEVVENRPAVIRLAHEFFQVPRDHPRLRVIQDDGEAFVGKLAGDKAYDMMFVDIFDSTGPASALSREDFLSACYGHLSEDGVLCLNLWNRTVDDFEQRFRRLGQLFPVRPLKLVLERVNSNVLVFVLRDPARLADLAGLRPRALALQQELGIKSLEHLRWLRQQNAV